MKVLMFGWEFPPYISGGLGTACHGLTQAMSQQGCEILFVLPKTTGDAKMEGPLNVQGADGYPIYDRQRSTYSESLHLVEEYSEKEEFFNKTIEFKSLLMPYQTEEEYEEHYQKTVAEWKRENSTELKGESESYKKSHIGEFQFQGGYGPHLMTEVYRFGQFGADVALDEEFDVIHAHDWMTYPAGIAAKYASGKPLVVHVHATEFDRSGQNVNQKVYDMERQGMHEADKICAVSRRTKQIVIDHYGVDPSKVEVVHNAVVKNLEDLPEYPRGLEEKTVLFLGRITMQKGPDFFIDAAHMVYQKLKNVQFVMAGSGDLYPRMIHRVAAMGMQDRFHFTGFLRGKDLDRVFSVSDLCIMPSVSEPFGIVPIEAMRFGLPVIVSKQSGVSEILDHAIKVDFWDTHLLAEKIIEVLTQTEETQTMVEKNNENLGRIDWKNAATHVIEVYNEVAS
jgi:glycosyltransferase involved in cell wall biosynthesis